MVDTSVLKNDLAILFMTVLALTVLAPHRQGAR
jgi:hypothetical protein